MITSVGVTFSVVSARRKNRRAATLSRRLETNTPMTYPYWSTARYTYRHTDPAHVRPEATVEVVETSPPPGRPEAAGSEE